GRDRIAGAAVLALAAGIAADSLVFHLVASTGNGTFLDWFYPDLAAKMAGGLMVWPFAWVYVTRSQQGPGRSDSRPTFDLLFGEQGRTER
ncbi:MAG: hypothetical protein GWN71_19900, partial [Gammaproteobacteria bacterium]|nr:hypothetical protein [Gemmatimonadota bacterium]NIU75747.1 hypothetical protein [Gammaproteobacteria bacterium]